MPGYRQLQELGALVRQLRKERKISGTELGLRIGKSQSYISAIENATCQGPNAIPMVPTDAALLSIAQELGVPVERFHAVLGRAPAEIIAANEEERRLLEASRIARGGHLRLLRELVETIIESDEEDRDTLRVQQQMLDDHAAFKTRPELTTHNSERTRRIAAFTNEGVGGSIDPEGQIHDPAARAEQRRQEDAEAARKLAELQAREEAEDAAEEEEERRKAAAFEAKKPKGKPISGTIGKQTRE